MKPYRVLMRSARKDGRWRVVLETNDRARAHRQYVYSREVMGCGALMLVEPDGLGGATVRGCNQDGVTIVISPAEIAAAIGDAS